MNQKFYNIFVVHWCFEPWKLPAVDDSIVLVDALTCSALIHTICDLKATQITMQQSLIYETKKKKCCAKVDSEDDHSIVTRGSKKFCSGCQNLNTHAKSGKPKTVDFEAVF